MNEYQPGVCNIGRDERRKRRLSGILSLLAAVGVVGFVLLSDRPDTLLLWSFPLFFGGFIGLLQDRLGFCAGFGALARYDLSESGGGAGKINEREAVRRDRIRALQVVGYATAAALVATAAAYALGTAL